MEDLCKNITKLAFGKANKAIIDFTRSQKTISDDVLLTILSWENKELINTFFENFNLFSSNQLSVLENYINKNLNSKDKDFVSDLIDFASDWSLNIDYKNLLSFLSMDDDEYHFVVLSTVNYITENIKLFYVEEIVSSMRKILDNPNYYQNTQISASLCLYRITHNKDYLLEIKDWFDIDENKEFLKNKLKLKYYDGKYFPDIEEILN